MTNDPIISTGYHWSYGWLRRSDLDDENGYCYEDADGDLIYSQYFQHRNRCKLACREDTVTKERYLCFDRTCLAD